MKRLIFVLPALCLAAGSARALEAKADAQTKAPAAKVWSAVGNFCGIAKWHPAIAKCEMSKADRATIRKLTTNDGAVITEKLVKFDKRGRSYTYQIIDGPLPVANYESTLSVTANRGGSTVAWVGHFDAKGASDADAQKAIQGIYDAGLANLVKPFQTK